MKKHPLLSKPILFAFFLAIVPLVFSSILGSLTAKLLNNVFQLGLDAESGTELIGFLNSVFRILSSLVIIYLMKRACGKDFRYGFDGQNLVKGFILVSPVLFMAAFNFPEYYLKGGHIKSGLPLAAAFVNGFAPGLFEEVVLRGTILSNMMWQWRDKKNPVLRSLVASSLVFGVLHLVNLTSAGVAVTLMQVGYAAGVGFLFGAAYLRSRNIVGPVVCHAIVDTTAFIFAVPADAPEVIPFTVATTIIITVGGVLMGLWMTRKEKQPEILALFT